VGADIESWLGFERMGDQPRFTQTDRRLLEYASRPLKWFHRPICLSHGFTLAKSPLTPTERRLLNQLPGKETEGTIAQELGLSPTTVHTYATRIYRNFNVQGRTGLTALWLGR
jgi:DNA-binding CsgD family transcriptional regulator